MRSPFFVLRVGSLFCFTYDSLTAKRHYVWINEPTQVIFDRCDHRRGLVWF